MPEYRPRQLYRVAADTPSSAAICSPVLPARAGNRRCRKGDSDRCAVAVESAVGVPVSQVFAPTAAVTESDFDACYALNIKVPFFLVAAIAPGWSSAGTG